LTHTVPSLEEATDFLKDVLQFTVRHQDQRSVLLDNGTLQLRLLSSEAPHAPDSQRLRLEISTKRLKKSATHLLARHDVKLLKEESHINMWRSELHLQTDYGIDLILFRKFNEDELGVLPELPISLDWPEDVQEPLKHILCCVPLAFRDKARKEITERAEYLTAEQGNITVAKEQAMLACAQATPLFQHHSLQEKMREVGIDPTPYFKDIEYPEELLRLHQTESQESEGQEE